MLTISGGKLPLTVFTLAEDVAVAAGVHIVGHAPYVNCPGKAEYANMNGLGVRGAEAATLDEG